MTTTKSSRRRLSGGVKRLSTATVIAGLSLGLLSAVANADPDEDAQVIDPNQAQGTGQVVLEEGHIDFGPTLNTGEWIVEIHDDTQSPSLWRHLDDVVMKVSDDAIVDVPDSEEYSFLKMSPGSQAWVIPQVQKPGVVWVGWNTQEPGVLQSLDMGSTLRVTGVDGPGDVTVFIQSGNFGVPTVLWSSLEEFPQESWIEVNTHTHANWVFSEPGIYLVNVEFTGDLITKEHVSATGTLRFAVGNQIDPQEAFAATSDEGAEEGGEGETSEEAQSAVTTETESAESPDQQVVADDGISTLIWIIVGAIGVALLFAIIIVAVGTSRAKKAARAGTTKTTEKQ